AEEGRVAIRQARKDANDEIKQRQKDGELSEDDSRREQDDVQKLTNQYVERVDELLKRKEAEVLEV
ncbi:MAG: ribosome recycling factor, partial [Gemmatimonadetes bacterium]|nr:ribosome recycling factor [Gemmatimonadota bacterium]